MENRINIGDLDTKIELVASYQTIGDQGQRVIQTSSFGEVWAHVEPLTDEMVGDDNLEARTGVSVTVYKVAHLTTRWQLRIAGIPYEIRSIDPISRWSPFCILTATTIEK